MRRSRDYSEYKKVYFKPEFDECPCCGSILRRDHIAWRKNIQTLNEKIYATNYAYRCSGDRCGKMYRSAEADLISIPFRSYSIDVIAEIGFLRHEEKRSIPEIHSILRERGIEICERECYDLVHVFEEIIAIRPVEFDPDFLDNAVRNGGIVLAIDGVQPERGNSTLYVMQDALTSKVLYADYLNDSSSDNVASLLAYVRDQLGKIGIDIIAVISDHQASIRLGVRKALPGIRHQFCHFHVLRNACLPIMDLDRGLKKNIRKRIKGIAPIERSLMSREDKPAVEIRDLCSLLRSLLIYPGTKPLTFSGMKVYQELASLDGTVRRMIMERDDRDLVRISRITCRWREFRNQYHAIASLVQYANKLRGILDPESSSEGVKRSLEVFLETVKGKILEGGIYSNLTAMVETVEHHWDGLFFCYDDRRIPRTDNNLEITIRHNKTGYRRMSGFRSWDGFIANYGKSTFMIPQDVSRATLIEMTENVDRKAFRERWKDFGSRKRVQSLMRKASKGYNAALWEIEERWVSKNGQNTGS